MLLMRLFSNRACVEPDKFPYRIGKLRVVLQFLQSLFKLFALIRSFSFGFQKHSFHAFNSYFYIYKPFHLFVGEFGVKGVFSPSA